MQTNKKFKEEFHSVDYMRHIRNQYTDNFFADKQKYLDQLKKAMQDFKLQQTKIHI